MRKKEKKAKTIRRLLRSALEEFSWERENIKTLEDLHELTQQ